MVLISKHWITSFSTAQDSLMKGKIFILRLKGLSSTFLEKPKQVLHQYFFMAIKVFQLNLQNILNLSIDYILSIKKFKSALFIRHFLLFSSFLDLFSLFSFILTSFFVSIYVSSKYARFYYAWLLSFLRFYVFVYIYIYIYIFQLRFDHDLHKKVLYVRQL